MVENPLATGGMSGQNLNPNPGMGLRLDIADLSEEETLYEWVIGPEMFADCPEPLPLAGPLKARGRVRKSDSTIYFSGEASGAFSLTCSRCAKSFELPVEVEAEAVFLPASEDAAKRASAYEEESGEVAYYTEDIVDVFPPLRDQVTLAEPMRPLCSQECKGLCPRCGADLNEAKCGCKEESGDPRFAELKKLLTEQEGENASS